MSIEAFDTNAKEFESCLLSKDKDIENAKCSTCLSEDAKNYFKHKFYFILKGEHFYENFILCEACARTICVMQHIQTEFYKRVLEYSKEKDAAEDKEKENLE